MKKIFMSSIVLFILVRSFAQIASPELIGSAGNTYLNGNFSLNWSIGEPVIDTYAESGIILTQGFHQNCYVITAIEDLRSDIEISVYPNPTTDYINLQLISGFEIRNGDVLQYLITDFGGKILEEGKLFTSIQSLNFSNFASGTFFLKILFKNRIIKTFKIIKY